MQQSFKESDNHEIINLYSKFWTGTTQVSLSSSVRQPTTYICCCWCSISSCTTSSPEPGYCYQRWKRSREDWKCKSLVEAACLPWEGNWNK